MRIFITGGTGLLGRELVGRRLARGDSVTVLTRRPSAGPNPAAVAGARFVSGDPTLDGPWLDHLDQADAVVNLAGQNLFDRRWTPAFKRSLRDSRVATTQHIARKMAASSTPPRVLVQGSAIGFYGDQGESWLDETSPPAPGDFLSDLCAEWEAAAQPVRDRGVRLALIRTGVVLARGAGALGVMEPLFRAAPGAPLGGGRLAVLPANGSPWVSWIHLADAVGHLEQAIDHPHASGPINATAPHPVRNRDLTRALSATLRRPLTFWRFALPLGPPALLLRLALGEVSNLLTSSQRVRSTAAERLGYRFQFPTLPLALANLFASAPASR
jgi:uncharacterized protein (TIGR01777 family)